MVTILDWSQWWEEKLPFGAAAPARTLQASREGRCLRGRCHSHHILLLRLHKLVWTQLNWRFHAFSGVMWTPLRSQTSKSSQGDASLPSVSWIHSHRVSQVLLILLFIRMQQHQCQFNTDVFDDWYNLNSQFYVLILQPCGCSLFTIRPVDCRRNNEAFGSYWLIEEVQIFGGSGHPGVLMKGGSSLEHPGKHSN